ncbi:flagellar biosynthesis protein FlhF [Savagea faecisuis]|uniref:Flagellar biosynthesis protein FlhF n=1 Tax=Savagea faecisuis TaxID=1274803 RepID=A0ABW3H270_9BACL
MKQKTYVADSMVEAMQLVRADFGEDAVIIRSSVIQTKGFLGMFKKNKVEVVAGLEEPIIRPASSRLVQLKDTDRELERKESERMTEELLEMKQMLQQLQTKSNKDHYPKPLQVIYEGLMDHELNEKLTLQICDAVYQKIKTKDVVDDELLMKLVRQALLQQFEQYECGGVTFDKKFINIVGPTGVGKTTTIAKIAARALLEKKKKIGFMTTDTYRIAAIEQLKTYANLLQAPVEVVYSREDFERAMDRYADYDIVFIDTAGRNYKDAQFVKDLNDLIQFNQTMESYLVLSLVSKERDMIEIAKQFEHVPIRRFIFTKADEATNVGSIFNMMDAFSLGVAYITDGQEVPEDLEEASVEQLVDRLLEGVNCDE